MRQKPSRPREADQGNQMNKLLLAAVGVMTVGLSVPASAADLAARPYTKAPPMIAAVYDWSGFYIGINGGWGTEQNLYDLHVPPLPDLAGCCIPPRGTHWRS